MIITKVDLVPLQFCFISSDNDYSDSGPVSRYKHFETVLEWKGKVKVDDDQGMAQSDKKSHSKHRDGKKLK